MVVVVRPISDGGSGLGGVERSEMVVAITLTSDGGGGKGGEGEKGNGVGNQEAIEYYYYIIIQDNKIHRPKFGLYESLVIGSLSRLIGWSFKCSSSRFLKMLMFSASTTLFSSSFHALDIRW